MDFWFYAGFMMLLASSFVLVPVLTFRQSGSSESGIRRKKNIELFRQRLDELQAELEMNTIEAEEFLHIEAELKRAFLADMPAEKGTTPVRPLSLMHRLYPLAFMVLVIFLGTKLYAHVGAADDLVISKLIQRVNKPESQAQQDRDFRSLARLLEQRGRKRPDDMMNAYMLGTLYLRLQQYQEAVSTFSMMSDQLGNPADRMMVLKLLARAQSLAAGGGQVAQASFNPHINERGSGVAGIQVHVDIDETIRTRLEDGMHLFVFARDPEKNIPLAVGSFDINAIPDIITLDDSMAMMPQFTISSAKTLYIGARVSRQATASSGDFQSMTDIFSPEQHSGLISLTITEAIP